MDVERALISSALNEGSLQAIVSRDIGVDHFVSKAVGAEPSTAQVWEWVIDHIRRYRAEPSKDLFKRRWPGFIIFDATDPFKAVLDEFIKVVKRRELINSIRVLAEIADDWDRVGDAEVYVQQVAKDLASTVPTTSVIRYSDSLDRRDEYLKRLDTGNTARISTIISEFDDATGGGIQDYEVFVIEGFLNQGKAQPLYSNVLTPDGWVSMGDLSIGEEIVSSSGGVQEVTHIFPRGRRDVYLVEFSDGSSTECCKEHLWALKNMGDRKLGKDWQVKQLGEVIDDLRYPSGQSKWIAPMAEPVQFKERELPLDPYLLGVMIGDGCFRNSTPSFTSIDSEIISEVGRLVPAGMNVKRIGRESSVTYSITSGCRRRGGRIEGRENVLNGHLRDLGLENLLSQEKFVPDEYMIGSIDQRLHLLQGLCDTDASVTMEGSAGEFCSTSKVLASQVVELARSLGGKAKMKQKKNSGYRDQEGVFIRCRPSYRVLLSLAPGLNPFRLARKSVLYKGRAKDHIRTLKSVTKVCRTETQCIMVSADDHLYVTDDYVLTHNSSLGVAQAAKAYFERGETPLFMTLEMEGSKLANRWDSYAAGVQYSMMKRLELGEGDLERWERIGERAADAKLEKDIIVIDDLYKPSSERIQTEIEKWKPNFVILDPIDEISAPSHYKSLYERQGYAIREIKSMARVMRMPFIVMAQAGRDAEQEGATLGNVAGSIDIARKADIAIGLHATPEMQKMKKMRLQILKVRDDGGKGMTVNYFWDVGNMVYRPWLPEDAAPVRPAQAAA